VTGKKKLVKLTSKQGKLPTRREGNKVALSRQLTT